MRVVGFFFIVLGLALLPACPSPPEVKDCGGACKPTQFCQDNRCVCRLGSTTCGIDCADLQKDLAHCGACGVVCPKGASCVGGQCRCPASASVCAGACVDLLSDGGHCGKCGTACSAPQVCSYGGCQAACEAPASTACSEACVDLQSNPLHCGGCGKACKPREACEGGVCRCPQGFQACSEDCVDLRVDGRHCGKCDQACPEGQACSQGQCVATCPATTATVCFGGCFSTEASTEHCGGCGKACASQERCQKGTCLCAEGLTSCGGRCVDVQATRTHCGACDKACPEGQICAQGVCVTTCPAPTPTVCFGGCVDLKGDARHCGGCGRLCGVGQICRQGACACEREIPKDKLDNDCDGKVDESPYSRVETLTGGSPAALVPLNHPSGVAVDSQGAVIVADTRNHTIRKRDASGVFQILAGTGNPGDSDGAGATAEFRAPHSIYVDPSGQIYVADTQNHKIRKIDRSGQVTTIAGDGRGGYRDGEAEGAAFNQPLDVRGDGRGNLYIADVGNLRIRKLDSQRQVTTFAGDGTSGLRDGVGKQAQFKNPHNLAIDSAGQIYVADSEGHAIRRISPSGEVKTIAGGGVEGYKDGDASIAAFSLPSGLAFDSQGNLYIADDGNLRVRMLSATGQVSTVVGSGKSGSQDGPVATATFGSIHHIAVDAQGALYLADLGGNLIRKAEGGQVTTLGIPKDFQDGPLKEARFAGLSGLAFHPTFGIVLADTQNQRIRKIDAAGQVTTLAGKGTAGFTEGKGAEAEFRFPTGVAWGAQGEVYVADTENHRIRKIDASGQVTTLAGNGASGRVDGPGEQASFSFPRGLLVGPKGEIYVADTENHSIRKIDASGQVTTLAGSPTPGFGDGLAGQALFSSPTGLALDRLGDLYIADTRNHAIRKLSQAGQVTTLAGNGTAGLRDGLQGQFNEPTHLAFDGQQMLLVVDSQNHRIRQIDSQGEVTTIVGQGAGFTDGNLSQALFRLPFGIAVDPQGTLLITDKGNSCLRRILE